jgi:hypothetical protein
MYDWEIAQIGEIWKELNKDWMRRPNTKNVLQEFAKVANERFLKAGFVVNVQWENTLIMVPGVNGIKPLPITIEVLGRVNPLPDGFDHERKRHEVLASKQRGEAFLGQKDGRVIK